jgi:hypothetical protein
MKQAFKKIGLICTLLVFMPFVSSLLLQFNQAQSQQTSFRNTPEPERIDEEILKPSNWIARGGCWDFSNNIISAQAIVGSCKLYYSKAIYKDFTLEVKLNKLAESGAFGLLIRYDEQKDEGYTYSLFPSSGYFFATIGGGDYPHSFSSAPVPFMNKGLNTWNTLKIVCQGAKFDLYLNGQFLSTITDSAYSSGRIGLTIGGDPRQRALFEIISLIVLQ